MITTINASDIIWIEYNIDKYEVTIEMANETFMVFGCMDEEHMYRRYDNICWCMEHDRNFTYDDYTDLLVII